MHTLFDLLTAQKIYGGSGGGGGSAVLEPLTAQANGVFTPPSGVDGFSSVTVSLPDGDNINY